jgi:hypothetical protein
MDKDVKERVKGQIEVSLEKLVVATETGIPWEDLIKL